MNMICFDLEGVLVPEIWIAFSEVSGIPELRRTTRDEPDYSKLMNWRIGILREHGLGLREIQQTIEISIRFPVRRSFWMSCAASPRRSSSATPSVSLPDL